MLAFKKYPWLAFFVTGAFIVLIALGTWQLKRLHWKNGLVRQMEQNMALPAINIPSDEHLVEQMQFRKVKARGRFLNHNEIHLAARYYNDKVGLNILTPFALNNGKVILVNRGWVPPDKKQAKTRPDSLIEGKTEINAVIMKPNKRGWFIPDNDPEKNFWFWVDIPAIESHTGLKIIPMILQETGSNRNEKLPVKLPAKAELRNDHLEYAITWYALAAGLLVVYFLFLREQR